MSAGPLLLAAVEGTAELPWWLAPAGLAGLVGYGLRGTVDWRRLLRPPSQRGKMPEACAKALGWEDGHGAVRRVRLRDGRRQWLASVPRAFPAGSHERQAKVEAEVSARVPAPAGHRWAFTWRATRRSHVLIITPVPVLPTRAPHAVESAREGALPFAVGAGGEALSWRYGDVGAVHALIVGTTGAGKTWTARLLLVEAVRTGAEVIALDPKRGVDWVWLRGLEGCTLATEATAIAREIARARRAMERRLDEVMAHKERDVQAMREGQPRPRPPRPRPLFVFVDEVAVLLERVKGTTPEAKAATEVRGRMAADLAAIGAQGRAADVHLIVATQRAPATTLAPDLKNNLQWRLMLGASDGTTERMMFDRTAERPEGPVPPGRALAQVGLGPVVEVQCHCLPEEEAMALLRDVPVRAPAKAAPVTEPAQVTGSDW